ncbi:abc transporter [Stylonychia lemnae]|uniref:Abc transporter n=1 Tax=Stylonychia lemnae TaxID=5949 RepID=A0A078B246_STYLE|nr:abc transporter [Stylonychia lemnae]|eukprot:CDW87468.1 abc transporter [Stylonychia lemnae]
MENQKEPLLGSNSVGQEQSHERPESIEQNQKKEQKLFKGNIAIESTGVFGKIFFNWCFPFVQAATNEGLKLEQLGDLRDKDQINNQEKKIRNSWEYYKQTKSKNSLIRAVFYAYRWEYGFAFALNLIGGSCEFASPFLINLIIGFIEEPGQETYWGALYVAALVITQCLNYILFEHIIYQQVMVGVSSVNSLVVLIYEKLFRISSATNKQFSQGEIVNFIQVDAESLFILSFDMPTMIKFPTILILSTAFCFYYLGLSFFAGIGVFVLGFLTNFILGMISASLWKTLMGKKDQRMNSTTETIQNIKMIKLYGWNETFMKRIGEKRENELSALRRAFFVSCFIVTSLYLFPQMLSPVVFTTYIGYGGKLDLKTTFTILTFFNLIKEPLRSVPLFFGELAETLVSMRRIQKFLKSDEINSSIVSQTDVKYQLLISQDINNEDSINIEKGNFSWGFPYKKTKEDLELEREDEDDQDKDKKEEKEDVSKTKVNDQEGDQTVLIAADEKKEIIPKQIKDLILLKNFDLKIKRGEFITIIGEQVQYIHINLHSVGSGKSSLLNAIIGDMLYIDEEIINQFGGLEAELDEDKMQELKEQVLSKVHEVKPIKIYGQLSYVQQQPWIQNMTIRDNILFDQPYVESKYNQIIKDCELERDLEILPQGDMIEIGEKGINLSGGQKARVSLARAVYANKDIILMDDPISALDANVRKKIFKNVIMKQFKDKTRILVTHAMDFLQHTDRIIILKNGEIAAQGSYDELKDNEQLQENLKIHKKNNQHSNQMNDVKYNEDSMVIQQIPHIQTLQTVSDNQRQTIMTENLKTIEIVDDDIQIEDDQPILGEKPRTKKQMVEDGKILEDEDKEIIRVQPESYKTLLRLSGGWQLLLIVNFAMIFFVGSQVYSDYLIGKWTQSLSDDKGKEDFKYFTFMVFGMAIINSICAFIRTFTIQFFSISASKNLHNRMIARIIKAPINLFFDVTPIGRILNRFSKDLTTLDQDIAFTISTAVVCFYGVVSTLVVSAVAIYWIVIPIPLVLFLLYKVFKYSINSYRESSRIESITKSPLISFLSETAAGISTIRSFKKSDEFITRNFKLLNNNILANQVQNGIGAWISLRLDAISISVMALACSFCLVFKDSSDPVMIGMLLTYILNLTDLLLYLMYLISQIERKMVSVQRCFKLLDIPQESESTQEQKEIFKQFNSEWPQEGKVEFKEVCLKYRPTTEIVLNQLSFEVKPGEKIGIVGRTGAGKSTMSLSLTRIVELLSGQIEIDGIDIKNVPLDILRQKITIIPQDTTMFKETLRFNMDPENQNNDERIKQLLIEGGLESLLNRDEKGLLMQIDENGSNLSSGEKQLICICRAILRKNKIVLLDEATANIDVVTEQSIQKLINLEFKDATVITIAHRLNTIINSDRVLVLSFGQLLEYDSPENLMQNENSEFYKLLQELKKEQDKHHQSESNNLS